MIVETFLFGILFGVCVTLLVLIFGIALYVRVKGSFTITPPPQWKEIDGG